MESWADLVFVRPLIAFLVGGLAAFALYRDVQEAASPAFVALAAFLGIGVVRLVLRSDRLWWS